MALSAPFISVFDPDDRGEGSVDPLSLQATAERLSERILPFVTSRMSRVRFLTAICAGVVACDDLLHETAVDDRTPGWIVFEWHVVEALHRERVRLGGRDEAGQRIPGIRKVEQVVQKNQRISAATYLKTPTVFGYTGIYRRLGLGLRLFDEELRLDDSGFELLKAWEVDADLRGFVDETGSGGEFRKALHRSVRQGLERGMSSQPPGWAEWSRIAEAFHPSRAGRRERQVLSRALFSEDGRPNVADPAATAMRREVLERLRARGRSVLREDEPEFLGDLMKVGSDALQDRVEAIDAYERFCRVVRDGFDLIRAISTSRETAPVDAEVFGSSKEARLVSRRLPQAVRRLERAQFPEGLVGAVGDLLARYGDASSPAAFFNAVLQHHEQAQREKPPDGKRAWWSGDGKGVIVRPSYRVEERSPLGEGYVHDHRFGSASSFLRDLRELPR